MFGGPHHSYSELKKKVKYTPNTFLFPERELTTSQIATFVSLLTNNTKFDVFLVITKSQNIIIDMFDGCVRILIEDEDIVDCPVKTFMANIHTIRYDILENDDYKSSDGGIWKKNSATKTINELIELINTNPTLTREEYDNLKTKVNLIGEDVLRIKLNQMMDSQVKIENQSELDSEIERLERQIERLKEKERQILNNK